KAIQMAGDDIPETLITGVREEEARRRDLVAELEALKAGKVLPFDERKLHQQMREQVADVRRLLEGNISQTRQILRKLLVATLVSASFEDGEHRGYRFTGQGSYEPILPVATLGVTPAGHDSFTSWPTLPFETLALAP